MLYCMMDRGPAQIDRSWRMGRGAGSALAGLEDGVPRRMRRIAQGWPAQRGQPQDNEETETDWLAGYPGQPRCAGSLGCATNLLRATTSATRDGIQDAEVTVESQILRAKLIAEVQLSAGAEFQPEKLHRRCPTGHAQPAKLRAKLSADVELSAGAEFQLEKLCPPFGARKRVVGAH